LDANACKNADDSMTAILMSHLGLKTKTSQPLKYWPELHAKDKAIERIEKIKTFPYGTSS